MSLVLGREGLEVDLVEKTLRANGMHSLEFLYCSMPQELSTCKINVEHHKINSLAMYLVYMTIQVRLSTVDCRSVV